MSPVGAGELLYINQGIQAGVRTDGRGRGDIRPAEFELNVIAQAHGSARLHMGATDVLVGVKVPAVCHELCACLSHSAG
jgi:exosome complex component RRP42